MYGGCSHNETMAIKCKNCGKLEKNHHTGTGSNRGGAWCYLVDKIKPEDKRYFMRFELNDAKRGN